MMHDVETVVTAASPEVFLRGKQLSQIRLPPLCIRVDKAVVAGTQMAQCDGENPVTEVHIHDHANSGFSFQRLLVDVHREAELFQACPGHIKVQRSSVKVNKSGHLP